MKNVIGELFSDKSLIIDISPNQFLIIANG